MHVCDTSTLSLEKPALLDKLHELEESYLEKVDKLVKLEEKYEILQETFKISEKRLVEKEIQCKSLTEKIFIVNALTESNDNPKTSMSTKELEIKPSKRKTKKLKSRGRNANKTSDSDENQALAKEKNDLFRQTDFLNSIILDTKLKESNKSKAQFFKKRRQRHKYKKHESVTIRRTQFGTQLKLRPKFCEPYLIKTIKPHDRNEVKNVGQHEGWLTTFWIFFRCGQLIFRMADCEVEGATASSRSIPQQIVSKGNERAISPTGKGAAREGT
ncbi:hypothetical protein TNCV_3457981 [Trichonephila clavipes]|nr:hypothetical protein TNCV_3457981 [Trichonephila clavipes]